MEGYDKIGVANESTDKRIHGRKENRVGIGTISLDRFGKRIWVNRKEIRTVYLKLVSLLFSAVGAVALFVDLTEYVPGIGQAAWILAGLVVLPLIPAGIWGISQKEKRISRTPGHGVLTVKFGDLFREDARIKVIPVNRCFDTVVSQELISKRTLHGAWICGYLKTHTLEELDGEIAKQLEGKPYKEVWEKRLGKKRRYPVGTVVQIQHRGVIYYLTAMTVLDEETLRASCTKEAYCLGVMRLMNYFDIHGQQESLAMPLVGGGAARMQKSPAELLQCLLSLIEMGRNRGQGAIKIVLPGELKEEISLSELH